MQTAMKVSENFKEGAVIIYEIMKIAMDYLIGESDNTTELPKLFTKVMEIMTDGFLLL